MLRLSRAERAAYERWQDDLHLQASLVQSNFALGKIEGRKEGIAKGRKEGLGEGREEGAGARTLAIARTMKADGAPMEQIARYTAPDPDEIAQP